MPNIYNFGDIKFNRDTNSLLDINNDGNVNLKFDNNRLVVDTRTKHFFSIGSYKRENQAIRASTIEFSNQLKSTVIHKLGEKRGLSLFNRYIRTKDDGSVRIKSNDVINLIIATKREECKLFKSALNYKDNYTKDFDNFKALRDKAGINKDLIRECLAKSSALCEPSLHDKNALLNKLTDLKIVKFNLEDIRKNIDKVNVTTENTNLAETKDNILNIIDKKIDELNRVSNATEAEIASNPLSMENIKSGGKEIIDACKQTLETVKKVYHNDKKVLNKLSICDNLIKEQEDKINAASKSKNVTAKDLKFFKSITDNIAKSISDATGVDKKFLKNNIQKHMSNNLEKKDWNIINKSFHITCNKKLINVTSTQTPASKLPYLGKELKDSKINGVVCSDQSRDKHAVNLWTTNFKYEDKELYSGIRHGVNCAYQINDDQRRAAANINRAKDIFKAALVSNPNLLEAAKSHPNVPVDLGLVSVSLLTPDLGRSMFGKLDGNERQMIAEQNAAWKAACDENGVCQLTLTDDNGQEITVAVKPKVLTFNYGVNAWGQESAKQLVAMSWGVSDAMNNASIQQFVGDPSRENVIGGLVGNFYDNCKDAKVKNKIEILVRQIKQMHNASLYRVEGADPYRLPARLNLLAYLCGMTPCFNCKSGKDRTGQMDASTKELAIALEMKGNNISINTTEDDERKKMITDIALNSGNLEIQKLNTGMGGFRLKGQIAIKNLYDQENLSAYYGLSELTKS